MAPAIVVFGYGNPGRGDDALGPLLLERAEAWAGLHPGTDLALVGDFQLQIEHAEDLHGRSIALFLDADASCPPPFSFRRIGPVRDESYTTHELSPESVLDVFRSVHARTPPPAFVLSVAASRFELGEPLSEEAAGNLERAWSFLDDLLADARPERWGERIS